MKDCCLNTAESIICEDRSIRETSENEKSHCFPKIRLKSAQYFASKLLLSQNT